MKVTITGGLMLMINSNMFAKAFFEFNELTFYNNFV